MGPSVGAEVTVEGRVGAGKLVLMGVLAVKHPHISRRETERHTMQAASNLSCRMRKTTTTTTSYTCLVRFTFSLFLTFKDFVWVDIRGKRKKGGSRLSRRLLAFKLQSTKFGLIITRPK